MARSASHGTEVLRKEGCSLETAVLRPGQFLAPGGLSGLGPVLRKRMVVTVPAGPWRPGGKRQGVGCLPQ